MSIIDKVSIFFSRSFSGNLDYLKKEIKKFNTQLLERKGGKFQIICSCNYSQTELIKSDKIVILQVRWEEGPGPSYPKDYIMTIPYDQSKNLKKDILKMIE